MHIAHVVPQGEQPWSGVLTVIVHLAAALARRGHDVEVWQLHDWEKGRYEHQRTRLDRDGVSLVRVPGSGNLGGSVARLVDDRSIDVVHLHGAFNRTNTSVSRALSRPYVFSPHSGYDPVSLRRSAGRKWLYRMLFERWMLQRAAVVVALTAQEEDDLRRSGFRGRSEVIPNGVEPSPGEVDRSMFRHDLGVALDDPLLVFVGRLDVDRKGLDVLVRGVSEAPGWHLALVGPRFRDVDRLERLIARLGIEDRVRLSGERHGEALREVFGAADVFALMSRWEGLPMSLLEALAMSTPAIVSQAVERLVPVAASAAGWAVDGGDLGRALRELAAQMPDAVEARRSAALALSQRYDWDLVAARYEDVYRGVLVGPGTG